MSRARFPLIAALLLTLASACGGDDPSPSTTASPPGATITLAPAASPSPSQTASTGTPGASIHPGPAGQPLGFPIAPATRLGLVSGSLGSRSIDWDGGPEALAYSRDAQPSDDPEAANRSGWNCRVHVEYEGQPAADWYIPAGTPVYATMNGTATLYAVTMANGFDSYGVAREPYLGNPDRSRASVSPFPGPSGGLGVWVEIDSGEFLSTYAHLDLAATTEQAVPANAFYAGFAPDTDFGASFGDIPASRQGTAIAQWTAHRGDLIGFSGDAGYSEAPHLHYAIQRAGANTLLCPTSEAGFDDGRWLLE